MRAIVASRTIGPMPSSPASRHLLIPFAGRSSPACQKAVGQLRLPNLASLLARLSLANDDTQDERTLSAPHERAMAGALGIAAADGLIPWAALAAQAQGLPNAVPGESWGLLSLCHWQVGIDDVVLGDPADVVIDSAESETMLQAARPFFEEDGIALHPGHRPGEWLAQGKVFDGLATASIDRAAGFPISEWSPLSDGARPIRRLQNEMQMLLYTARVNDDRVARGVPPINSFWLSGTGALAAVPDASRHPPEVDTRLRGPALHDDATAWCQAWEALDADLLAGLLADYTAGAAVQLTLCGDRGARTFAPQRLGIVERARRLFQRPAVANVLEAL